MGPDLVVENAALMRPTNSLQAVPSGSNRMELIERARRRVLEDGSPPTDAAIEPWILRSWQRCLGAGQRPRQPVAFDLLSAAAMRRTRDANQHLTAAAQPVLRQMARALAQTRYFAILTNADGVVVDAHGPIDTHDRRARLITRVGVDLSESSVGTTAIGAALRERHPVWLHRGEHFFQDTSVYSCAGAPLFGPQGQCVGMLDLTGVDAPERPELVHLAEQSAREIENRLLLRMPHSLRLRVQWPGQPPGGSTDGLICLDADGRVIGSNGMARRMLPELHPATDTGAPPAAASALFAVSDDMLQDAARRPQEAIELPLWSGLRLNGWAELPDQAAGAANARTPTRAPDARPLRDIETELIREAVAQARGKVAEAAERLGVSRATVYRKLGRHRG